MNRHGIRALGWLLLVVLITSARVLWAEPSNIAILSPEVREPFRTIFETIEQGVREGLNSNVKNYTLRSNFDENDLRKWAQKNKVGPIIALGVLGQEAAASLSGERTVVLGALLNVSSDVPSYAGIALTPDPDALFAQLRQLDSDIEYVKVVFNPDKSLWLLELAKQAATKHRLTLQVRYARDLKESANTYKDILDHANFEKEAIWLLQDSSIVDTKVVLPFILQEAWSRNAIVFSSSLGHVKQGALFSMYPDNKLHGMQLAELLRSEIKKPNGKKIYASSGLMRAINSRTAEHLGLRFSGADLNKYDVVFPLSN